MSKRVTKEEFGNVDAGTTRNKTSLETIDYIVIEMWESDWIAPKEQDV